MKIYVVLERHFEYNDETYDASEGGNVVHGYKTRKRAEEEVVKLIKENYKGPEALVYFIDQQLYITPEIVDIFKKQNIDIERDRYGNVWFDYEMFENLDTRKLTEDEIAEIVTNFNDVPYFIEEMEYSSK